MVPIVFDECRGWLHGAAGARRGAIVCGAMGFEDLCSRASMAALAGEIAARGCPALRFDWRGTADSLGDETGEDRLADWLADIRAAVATLVERTGVEEVALVGLRLGALLALRAARDIRPARLVLLAPPASGRAYARECEIAARVFAGGSRDEAFDGLEVAGFRTTRATLDGLRAFGPADVGNAAGLDTLLLTASEEAGALAEGLARAGARLVAAPLEGYAEMMCDPTAAAPPVAALARIADYCAEGVAPRASRALTAAPAVLEAEGWREEGASFGAHGRLAGVFCEPHGGARGAKTVVFLNAGGVYHIGWARMNVDMARALASGGVASLRMDLAGVGDSLSGVRPERAPLYQPGMVRDVEAALDWLEARGVGEIALFGACSGAYQAFHAALADRRVRKIAMVNPLCFIYGPTYALQIEAWRRTKSAGMALRMESAERPDEAPGARAVLFGLAGRLAKAGLAQATDAAAALHRGIGGNRVERWFGDLSARGAETLLVCSENDSSLVELERHLGARSRAEHPLPGLRRAIIPDSDHEMTPRAARARLADMLDRFLAA